MALVAEPTTLSADIEDKSHHISDKALAVDEEEVEWTEQDSILRKSAMRKLDWTLVPIFGASFHLPVLSMYAYVV